MAKKALLVGLNRYPDPDNTLRGCLNDVRQMHALLRTHFDFRSGSAISTLTDAEATTAAIVQQLHWLVDEAAPGDVLVFHYSGHGSQVDDRHGDEVDDGLDEIICPYDLDWNDPFTDDDLCEIVGKLPTGANLTVVLDCCHSGTGLREPAGGKSSERQRYMAPPTMPRRTASLTLRRFGHRASQRGAVLVAGCRADQVSADALIDGDYHGALTYYLCRALDELGYAASYQDVIRRVRRLLSENGYGQVPQLEGPSELLRLQAFAAPATAAVA
jgi:metacaspase-1